jgi:hypothetical protein
MAKKRTKSNGIGKRISVFLRVCIADIAGYAVTHFNMHIILWLWPCMLLECTVCQKRYVHTSGEQLRVNKQIYAMLNTPTDMLVY